jgi:hypothetical protein
MRAATWQDRVDALGRAHYRRYDERTATMLGDGAALLGRRWAGDLRKLHREADGDQRRAAKLLTEFPGIGPAGADIFLREVQGVWRDLAPHLDKRVLAGASLVGLPAQVKPLASLVDDNDTLTHLAAALVRVSLDKNLADEIKNAGG